MAAGDSLYLSGSEFDLEPLASEYYGDRAGTSYYSVALVPAAFCARSPAPTLASLKVSPCQSDISAAAVCATSASNPVAAATFTGFQSSLDLQVCSFSSCATPQQGVDEQTRLPVSNTPDIAACMQGLRACHTGYRRGAGWTLPQGTLLNSGVMQPVNNISNSAGAAADAQTMAAFFKGTCANQRAGNGAARNKTVWAGLCTACPVSPQSISSWMICT